MILQMIKQLNSFGNNLNIKPKLLRKNINLSKILKLKVFCLTYTKLHFSFANQSKY